MNLEKPKRIINQSFLYFIKTIPCIICRNLPSDPDHVVTRGAGGNDTANNVWSLCRKHHSERHSKGIGHMVETYPQCKTWLLNANRNDVLDRFLK